MKGFFCSFLNQVVTIPAMASHVLSKDQFAKVIELLKKIFCFRISRDSYVIKETKEIHEKTRDTFEKPQKFFFIFVIELPTFLCNVRKFLIPKRRNHILNFKQKNIYLEVENHLKAPTVRARRLFW